MLVGQDVQSMHGKRRATVESEESVRGCEPRRERLSIDGNSISAGNIGEHTRVVIGLGQRSVAQLQASHREATGGEVLFARGAD
jgi:hypothetical protein